jgi:hypothetical protein
MKYEFKYDGTTSILWGSTVYYRYKFIKVVCLKYIHHISLWHKYHILLLEMFKANVIPPLIGLYCNHLVCPSVRLFVRPFTLSLKISQLLLEEMILYLIYGFGMMTCTVSPLSRFTAHQYPDMVQVTMHAKAIYQI